MSTHRAPIWLMGLANTVFGMYLGFVVVSLPQILSARHVPETSIASFTAVAVSPGFWACALSPALDVRFSRRTYSIVTALASGLLLALGLVNLDRLTLAAALITTGCLGANLYQSALGGWLSSITTHKDQGQLSMWLTVGNVGGTGLMGFLGALVKQRLALVPGAILLGAFCVFPIAVFGFMPAPGADRRLASESFGRFSQDVLRLLKRREILLAMLLLALPSGTFSLTNFISGLGADFHASVAFVSMIAGLGVLLGAAAGIFMFPLVRGLLPVRPLYLVTGIVGALFTLTMILPHRNPDTFALALIGENVFQSLAITISVAIALDTVGNNNPFAATTYCLIVSAYNVPITYMLLVDGWGYGRGGLPGSYLADAGAGLIASALMLVVLRTLQPRRAVLEVATRLSR